MHASDPLIPADGDPGDDRRQLAAALSHDVRQHARLVSSYCSLLDRSVLDDRQRALLAVASDHADRLQQMLGALVRWLRLADEPLDLVPCALDSLWRDATADLLAEVSADPLPVINVDPAMMTELLRELARNAARYHGHRAHIVLGARREGSDWILEISDDGPGIPADQHERVLLPLHRLHTWEQVHGHGMGLTLAARIAARHGGDLRITHAPTGGCMVQVRIPA
jgi:signal transduction histidine kinase